MAVSMTYTRTAALNLFYIRAYSFTSIGAGGFILPFLALFYQEQGLSGSQIGVLVATAGVAGTLAAPVWGRWSDSSLRPRRLLQLALLGSGVCMLLLGLQTAFSWMVVFVASDALVGGGLEPLSTAQALAVTNREKSGFGSIRLWGSLGWAIIAPVSGWMIERRGLYSGFAGYFVGMAVSAAILGLVRTMTTAQSRAPKREEEANLTPGLPDHGQTQQPVGKLLATLSRDRSMVGLALALTILWLCGAGRLQFEAIYLKQLGASETIIGLTNTIGALVELPAMLLADRLVRRHGAGAVMQIALLLQAAGMSLVLIFPSVNAIIGMRAVSGIYYSLYLVASIAYVVRGAPQGRDSTVLALYMVTLRGLVGLVGAPLGGYLYDLFGAYWLYAIALGGTLLGWLTLRLTARPVTPGYVASF